MKEVKLKNGSKVKIKTIGIFDRAKIEDLIAVKYKNHPSTTLLEIFKIALDGDITDDYLESIWEEKDDIAAKIVGEIGLGEKNPSN